MSLKHGKIVKLVGFHWLEACIWVWSKELSRVTDRCHITTSNEHKQRNAIKVVEFFKNVEGEGILRAFKYRWLPRGTEKNARNNNRGILSPKPHQIRPRNCSELPYDLSVSKLWKPIPFALEFKFTVPVNTSQKNFTKSLNVKRRVSKWWRSVCGAGRRQKIDRSWN